PGNLLFEVDDAEEDWSWDDNYFDYIHVRSLCGVIADWGRLMGQVHDRTAPGGYSEFQEYICEPHYYDGTPLLTPDPAHPMVTY
ncbi:hypothetical protein DFH27DRAFT_472578, partial [Peziza echinospora]